MRSTAGGATFTDKARRAQIVDCAIETVADIGYHQATIRKIAERVGVAMSVVMYHFGNKDELVAAIVAELYRSLIAILVPAIGGEPTARGQLAAHIRGHLGYIGSHRSHQLALMDIGSNYRRKDGARLSEIEVDLEPAEMAELAKLELDAIFALGMRNGEFRELASDHMATAVRGAIGGALLKSMSDPDFGIAAYGDAIVSAFDLATRKS